MGNVVKYKLQIGVFKVGKDVEVPKEIKEKGYDIRKAIKSVVLHHEQKHPGFRYYTVSKVVNRIMACEDEFIILDNTEYAVLKESFDRFTGFGSGDDELVRRIYEVEKIEE